MTKSASPVPEIHVCSLRAVPDTAARIKPSHLITLLGPGPMADTPQHMKPTNHLRLVFNDINEPREGLIHPNEEHVAAVLTLARQWEQQAPLLIHCWAGISRSTAAAFTALCAM